MREHLFSHFLCCSFFFTFQESQKERFFGNSCFPLNFFFIPIFIIQELYDSNCYDVLPMCVLFYFLLVTRSPTEQTGISSHDYDGSTLPCSALHCSLYNTSNRELTMKSSALLLILSVCICAFVMPQSGAFVPAERGRSLVPYTSPTTSTATTTQLFFFGAPKDDGSPGDYVCKDCGYVFTKGPKAWAALDGKYQCPPCGSPKFRFKKVPKGTSSGKVEVKKGWFG